MKRNIYQLLMTVFVSVLAWSCGNDDPDPVKSTTRTIIVYIAADSNLSIESFVKLQQIIEGWNQSYNGTLLVYRDTPHSEYSDFLRITGKGNLGYDILETYGSSNSADANVFKSVIQKAVTDFPADSYGLIVFSHGTGWLPSDYKGYEINNKSIMDDKDEKMDIADFAEAIADNQFEFIVFEACNMAGVEVTYELKDKTKYILASSAPIVSPGFTPIYKNSLKHLFEPKANLKAFANDYYQHWNALTTKSRSATVSIIETSQLDDLAKAVKSINKSGIKEISVDDMFNYDGTKYAPYHFFDINQYYEQVATLDELKQLQNALEKCIVYKNNTPNYATQKYQFEIKAHSGLTTYVIQSALEDLNEQYYQLKWYQATKPD